MQIGRLLDFLLGYLVILVTPGPNMLVVGGVAALRGVRGALPICCGIAMGAAALVASIALVAAGVTSRDPEWEVAGRWLAVGLLAWGAVFVARLRPPGETTMPGRRSGVAAFGTGFCTAATNPLTAAFCAAQAIGPLASHPEVLVLAPALVGMAALGFALLVAVLLARPRFRAAALAWHRPIRLTAALSLALMALTTATTPP
ncbi:LysE family translocator [Roseicella aerolata]|uniref:LysE family transporter n=1 Tax=Roseicella aerolata TaxID=2883479 RepID=A0A9X1IHP8_9PROT|nr:LysE family transporter [Roseicella aerolata]